MANSEILLNEEHLVLGERDIEKKRSTWCKENKLLNEEKYSVQGEEAIE